jgi:16S rRNA (guanine(966)-N(2))-methyltransferase RsmD
MRTQVRIVAGALRGRKLICNVNPNLRPTPQMVREALFSVLGNAVPDRPFFDLFAGTGVVGLEAISRGASRTTFVERDFQLLGDLGKYLRQFDVEDRGQLVRADVYRWAERWQPPDEPVTVFISPPFADYENRLDNLLGLVALLQNKVADGSVIVLQAEHGVPLGELPHGEQWEDRRYGRNHLLFWVKEEGEPETNEPGSQA